jgi:hypothetical protein
LNRPADLQSIDGMSTNQPDGPLPSLGFVGVGRMGANMARRLKDCGFPIFKAHGVTGKGLPPTFKGVSRPLRGFELLV